VNLHWTKKKKKKKKICSVEILSSSYFGHILPILGALYFISHEDGIPTASCGRYCPSVCAQVFRLKEHQQRYLVCEFWEELGQQSINMAY
jgi:hypothetical protein